MATLWDIGSPVKRYRADLRKCCLYCCIIFLLLIILGVAIFLAIYFTRKVPAHAQTRLGLIRGRIQKSPQGDEVDEYLGIPFAEPPLGNLRYADPIPTGAYPNGEYDAFDMKQSCLQYLDTTFGDFTGSDMWNAKNLLSEDCLYMNIWVPRPQREKRAVLVWIHGGGFYSGSNALWVYDGKALAAYADVIVVSMNYRLGSFGFLSTGDGRIKGNFGLKDQRVALQWIRDNIAAFGGDPELVTLFGESSGAASVGYHQMSPESYHLFKRAIYESGSPDSHWSFMTLEQAQTRAQTFFEAVGCPNDENILGCLRQQSADHLFNNEWVDLNFMVFPWVPTVDGDFLSDVPYKLLKSGNFALKDSILGVNKDEGTFWILYTLAGMSKDTRSLQTYEMFLDAIDVMEHDLDNATRTRIKEMYTVSNTSDTAANRDALDEVCGDRSFTCPTTELTDIFISNGVKAFFYHLTYRASNEAWPPWMGVIHGAEIQWIFGMPLNGSRGYTIAEEDFAKKIMSYWANFAKYGDPNGPELPEWPQYTQINPSYLEMQSDVQLHARYNGPLRSPYCSQLWTDINRNLYTTYLNNRRRRRR